MNALALTLALATSDSSRAQEVNMAPLPPRPNVERISHLKTLKTLEPIAMAPVEAIRTSSDYTPTDRTLGIIFQ